MEYSGNDITIPQLAIWRHQILGNGLVSEMELVLDWTTTGEFNQEGVIINDITFSENGEVGIEITNLSKNNTISQNTVNHNDNGIILDLECNNNTVTGNTVNDNLYGILLDGAHGNNIYGNTLVGNRHCIEAFESNYNTLEDNNCRGRGGGAVPGYNLATLISLIGVIIPISAIIIRKRLKNK